MKARSAAWLVPALSIVVACSNRSGESKSELTNSVAQADLLASSFCAKGIGANDKEICVPDTQSANEAWRQAVNAKHTMPIQMWVPYPDPNLDAFVANLNELHAWFADIKALYVVLQSGYAESYAASMNGNMGQLVKAAKARQDTLIKTPPVTADPAIKAFEDALTTQAGTTTTPVGVALAKNKQDLAAVTAIVVDATNAVKAFEQSFTDISKRYRVYRATETSEIASYTQLSLRGASSTFDTMGALQDDIIRVNQTNSSAVDQIIIDATRLRMLLSAEEATYLARLSPYAGYFATTGAKRPDLTSAATRSLDNMVAYVQTRRDRNDALATQMLDQLAIRRQVLIQVATDKATQETTGQAKLLAASKAFLDSATQQTSDLWAAPTKSTKLKLPYLAARFDSFTAFMQFQPLCVVGAVGSWREAGCNALNQQFPAAQTYLQKTLPGLLKIGVVLMNGKGPSAAMLTDISSKVAAGNIKAAAVAYDEAVQQSDGSVMP